MNENLGSIGSLSRRIYRRLGPVARAACLVLAAALCPAPVWAQSTEIIETQAQFRALYSGGRYADALPFAERVVELSEVEFGPDHPNTAIALNDLAIGHQALARYEAAKPLLERALTIQVAALGVDHPQTALSLNNLGRVFADQGRYDEARPLFERAIEVLEMAFGPDYPAIATSLTNLANLHMEETRFGEAERLHKRALEIRARALGETHPEVADSLHGLATVFESQGRFDEAESYYVRALSIAEAALGPDAPAVAETLNNLANLYVLQRRADEAEAMYRRALASLRNAHGELHPHVALAMENLAILKMAKAEYGEAEELFERVVEIKQETLGESHSLVARALDQLANLRSVQGRRDDAIALRERALAIIQSSLGDTHRDVAVALNNIALDLDLLGRQDDALSTIRQATGILRKRIVAAQSQRHGRSASENRMVRYVYLRHVDLITRAVEGSPESRLALIDEAFEVMQLAGTSSAATAMARMAVRSSSENSALARAVRERQDAIERWQSLDQQLTDMLGRPTGEQDPLSAELIRALMTASESMIDTLDQTLERHFPKFAQLTNPKPLSLGDVQSLLGRQEALISFFVGADATYLWVLRHDAVEMQRIELTRQELEDSVIWLRSGLDQPGLSNLGSLKRYDVEEAYLLYQQLLAPVEALLDGARHIFVVPDAALQSLPIGVLVTEEPPGRIRKPSEYRAVAWLTRKFALTTLPSVGALFALREFAKLSQASRPFVGFGDPALTGSGSDTRGIDAGSLFTRGGIANVSAVSNLPRLPDTAIELEALARSLDADRRAVYLGELATEARVRAMDLLDYKVIAFATHGLVAGEFKGVIEPALVLTPPQSGTEADDGLITASEIMSLKLDADWVILSACNTAAADGRPGAEGLSGLARAFFYAGARALLVSHWSVNSEAAVAITTGMFGELAKNPGIGRAEALRRSMLTMMETEGKDYFAHPMFWAPFVVVGEGGTPM